MKRRILTAKEQLELLSPWTVTAAPKQLDLFGLGNPDMDFSVKDVGPKEVPEPNPKSKKDPAPKAPPASPERQLSIPYWMSNDWRTGDGGKFISDVRPQIPEVDLPHPSEYMTPEQWEAAKSSLKEPEYDPHGVLPDDLSFEDIVQGELKHLVPLYHDRDEDGREKGSAQEGRWWYPSAHESSKNAADMTTGDHERTVAEWSAYSPKNEWDNNIENGLQFSFNYPGRPGKPYEESMGKYGDPELGIPPYAKRQEGFDPENYDGPREFSMPAMNISDAQAIRHAPGKSFMDFLTGPKRQSFFRNIMDKSKMRDPRPGHDPVEDGGYYEMPTNPFTGEPDWRMHPQQIATMDTQHHRMTLAPPDASDEDLAGLKYETQPWFSRKKVIDGPDGRKTYEAGYELQHRAHWEALRRLNAMQEDPLKHLIPSQAQAGPWLDFRKRLDAARERVTGKAPREPGQLPKGVEAADPLPPRGQSLGIGEQGPLTEYDVTGKTGPVQDSKKGHDYPRYQKDYSYRGDPDYSQPGVLPGEDDWVLPLNGLERIPTHDDPDEERGLVAKDPSGRFQGHPPKTRLRNERRPVIPGTEHGRTPRDPRNRSEDLRTVRNKDRRAQRLWQGGIQDDKYPQHWMDKAEQLARDTGGFTIHDDPNNPGDAPTSGYQVAIPGYERTDIDNGQGWADFAHEINPVLKGENTGLGTWRNDEDGLYYTEPSEQFHDYDEGARATLDRNQWAMWDNGAFTVNPQTGEKDFLDQATIPRTDIAQQGIANSTGFTLAKNRGITYQPTALKHARRFWEG